MSKAPAAPIWFAWLEEEIVERINSVLRLYPERERRVVIWNMARALHWRANKIDPTDSWLALALEACGVGKIDLPSDRYFQSPIGTSHHPSRGDAEDVAEDISLIITPMGKESPHIIVRTAVHVVWTQFANNLDTRDRALLAAEAAALS